MSTSQSLKAFLHQIIDYAGLFPPAKLPMTEAFQNYLHHRHEPEHWMLSRFICPVVKLPELPLDLLNEQDRKIALSVLGRGGDHPTDFLNGLRNDLNMITEFTQKYGHQVTIDVFEVRLPLELVQAKNPAAIRDVLSETSDLIENEHPMTPFYEVESVSEWEKSVEAVVSGLAAHNQHVTNPSVRPDFRPAGFKLRCGGVEASAFPESSRVAMAIFACLQDNIAMKFTAGLHHPVRHFNESMQTKMHGFFNVFGAGMLAKVHNLNKDQITMIIDDENGEHFDFTDVAFSWQDLSIPTSEITKMRALFVSYGSCSFDEPREDLRMWELL